MTVTAALAGLAAAAVVPSLPVRRGGRVMGFDGTTVEAIGIEALVGGRALVGTGRQAAEIIGFRDGRAVLMGLSPLAGIVPGAPVLTDGIDTDVATGPALLGRIIDGLGRPLDGLGPIASAERRPAKGRVLVPGDRARVTAALDTGVRAIDGLLTLGRGQRVGIMAGTGVGKSVLLGQVARWAAADVVVMALIGERGREITDFIERELTGDARARTVTVAVPAGDAPLLRVRGAERAFAIAEGFRDAGQHVLLILDSLSRVVHGAREVALARGEHAGGRGYPPSAMALIAALAERAGGDRHSGGAITAIVTVLQEGDDTTDPVVDAARGVLDGHILLSRKLAGRGQFPAIDIATSASRVMADVCSDDHLAAAARFRRLSALIEDNRDLVLMGAYAPGADPELDAALALAPQLEAYRAQPRGERIDAATARAALGALVMP
ncbi:MAG: flagellum-specific ATP synthase FliI [Alphaproteobacteria bacterium]|nr:MAG: flagellum-specific ATP synthase FliI [Alphaproteobacteria bacterium]